MVADWNSGESIVQSLDGLSVGSYNYTIVVEDTSGNSASSTVLVNVLEEIPTSTGTSTNTEPGDNPFETASVVITVSSIAR